MYIYIQIMYTFRLFFKNIASLKRKSQIPLCALQRRRWWAVVPLHKSCVPRTAAGRRQLGGPQPEKIFRHLWEESKCLKMNRK